MLGYNCENFTVGLMLGEVKRQNKYFLEWSLLQRTMSHTGLKLLSAGGKSCVYVDFWPNILRHSCRHQILIILGYYYLLLCVGMHLIHKGVLLVRCQKLDSVTM